MILSHEIVYHAYKSRIDAGRIYETREAAIAADKSAAMHQMIGAHPSEWNVLFEDFDRESPLAKAVCFIAEIIREETNKRDMKALNKRIAERAHAIALDSPEAEAADGVASVPVEF